MVGEYSHFRHGLESILTTQPPNVKFEVDDIEAPWTYSKPFDLIFARYLDGAISDWPALVSNMYNNVRPGGWVEYVRSNRLADSNY